MAGCFDAGARTLLTAAFAIFVVPACSGEDARITDTTDASSPVSSTGGNTNVSTSSGGATTASGGASETGGATSAGGKTATGGAVTAGSGGTPATGGAAQTAGGSASLDSGAPDSTRGDAGPQPSALWVGDLETGDFSQYDTNATWNFEGAPVPAWPELVSRSSDSAHVGQGSFASRFELQNGQKRQELILPGSANLNFGEGDDLYFGYSLYVDASFNAGPSDWCVALQWKNDGTGSPPLEGEVRNDGFHFTGGYGHPNGTNPTHDQLIPGGLVRSRWVDFVVHVVFSSDPATGWYEVWVDDTRVLAPFHPPGGTLYPNLGSYHKHGLYCDPAISGSRIVWHDAWRIGRSYDSVDPRWGR
jgi:hypothetical protein